MIEFVNVIANMIEVLGVPKDDARVVVNSSRTNGAVQLGEALPTTVSDKVVGQSRLAVPESARVFVILSLWSLINGQVSSYVYGFCGKVIPAKMAWKVWKRRKAQMMSKADKNRSLN